MKPKKNVLLHGGGQSWDKWLLAEVERFKFVDIDGGPGHPHERLLVLKLKRGDKLVIPLEGKPEDKILKFLLEKGATNDDPNTQLEIGDLRQPPNPRDTPTE